MNATDDELAQRLEHILEEHPWRRGTVLRFRDQPGSAEYAIEALVEDGNMLDVQNLKTGQCIRWLREAFVYVRTMTYEERLVFDVMSS